MSDPNAIKWDERRIFTARIEGPNLALAVWGADGDHFWSVSRWDADADRSGVERSFLAAKRAAEKCARAWAPIHNANNRHRDECPAFSENGVVR